MALESLVWSVLLVGILYVIVKIWKFLETVQRIGNAAEQYPGVRKKKWFWGHLHSLPGFNEAGLKFTRDNVAQFPLGVHIWKGPVFCSIALRHPDSIRDVLKTSEPKPLHFGAYQFGRPWLGEGLVLSDGAKHSRNRKLLTPAFHFEILKPQLAVMNEASRTLVTKLDDCVQRGESMEFFNSVSLCTLDIILKCAFSYSDEVQIKGEKHPYVQAAHDLNDLWTDRTAKPWLWPDFIYFLTSSGRKFKRKCQFVHSVAEEVIRERRKTLAEKGEAAMKQGRYIDFLDILLTARDEDGNGMTDLEIRYEVDTFMFAGHDTTASATSWTLFSLAENPEHQRLIQEEIDEVLGDREYVEWDDLPKLKYMAMCIREALRLHTPAGFIERQLTKDLEVDGKVLPKGTVVHIQLYGLHHNPTVWGGDTTEFDPSRFSSENMEKRHPYAFLPFSAGPRNCIGQSFAMNEMKVVLAHILKKYTLSLDPQFPVKKKIAIVIRAADGIRLRASPR